MKKTKVGCELCDGEAALRCESDCAFLCWGCDARVHGANFLVSRHPRRLICVECGSAEGDQRPVSGPDSSRSASSAAPARTTATAGPCPPSRSLLPAVPPHGTLPPPPPASPAPNPGPRQANGTAAAGSPPSPPPRGPPPPSSSRAPSDLPPDQVLVGRGRAGGSVAAGGSLTREQRAPF
ncbi:unnamed protein product [Spirodela intermedia]|uniref:B box-type domain-containing protein n=1 Tax=Spirodela intermedia TaxID=51605 RepID=A0A7I8JJK0_SPIIN|nr:unnamed protein product [Spirodela intermedia]CAA6670357.1 unnamed protein product [Spirodela intermedia]